MINAQELRIGNLVKSGDGVYKIFAMSAAEVLAIQDISATLESQEKVYAAHLTILKPIPLTPEWLERFGFESMDEGTWFKWETVNEGGNVRLTLLTNDIYYNKGKYWFVGVSTYEGDADFLEERIKYVHRLQNLFWVLTGQELKTTE